MLLTDATSDWAALHKWTWDFFKTEDCGGCGGTVVQVTQTGGKKVAQKLCDYVRGVRSGLSSQGYLRGWEFEQDCPQMLSDFQVPSIFGVDWFEVNFSSVHCFLV